MAEMSTACDGSSHRKEVCEVQYLMEAAPGEMKVPLLIVLIIDGGAEGRLPGT